MHQGWRACRHLALFQDPNAREATGLFGATHPPRRAVLHGYTTLWIALLTFPLMAAVQLMCARLGMVTGRGLAASVRIQYPRWVPWGACSILVVANIINIGADLGGYRERRHARAHDDFLDARARHHRRDHRRQRYPHAFTPDKPTISSRRPHFFHIGRDPGPLTFAIS